MAGVYFRPQMFRHAFATHSKEKGVLMKDI